LENSDVPYYSWYIDDCFAIIYANSEEEAINKVSVVKFNDCVIEWNNVEILKKIASPQAGYRRPPSIALQVRCAVNRSSTTVNTVSEYDLNMKICSLCAFDEYEEGLPFSPQPQPSPTCRLVG